MSMLEYIREQSLRIILRLSRHGFLFWMKDQRYLSIVYFLQFGHHIDWNQPKTFNEKLQWIKIYDRRPLYTQLADKLMVRKYIEQKIGKEYLIPLLAVWDRPNNIDFAALPNEFVLKCNHDSGGIVICKNKEELDYSLAIRKLSKSFKNNGYNYGREWPYKNISKRVFAEQLMTNSKKSEELTDYKIHCFNGIPQFILVCKDRFTGTGMTEDFFTTSWDHLDLKRPKHENSKESIERPIELDKMLELAKKLADGLNFVRIDLYIANHKIYFGEMTFFPASGFAPFVPEKYDYQFGQLLNLCVNEDMN